MERRGNEHKQWHGAANRFEKRVLNYREMVFVGALMWWVWL
jgi:hypothetical protein